jgi:hypothetical protein
LQALGLFFSAILNNWQISPAKKQKGQGVLDAIGLAMFGIFELLFLVSGLMGGNPNVAYRPKEALLGLSELFGQSGTIFRIAEVEKRWGLTSCASCLSAGFAISRVVTNGVKYRFMTKSMPALKTAAGATAAVFAIGDELSAIVGFVAAFTGED